MLYVVPSLELTVVMTSNENNSSARTGYRDELNALMAETIAAITGRADAPARGWRRTHPGVHAVLPR